MSREELKCLIADDAYAASFQTMGQYRSSLLKAIDGAQAGGVPKGYALVPVDPSKDDMKALASYIARMVGEPYSSAYQHYFGEAKAAWSHVVTGTTQPQPSASGPEAAPQSSPAPAVAPTAQALPFAILPDEMEALSRFHECVTDGEGYDVPKDMMKRLSEIGLLRRVTANLYEHTNFGLSVLNGDFDAAPAQAEQQGDGDSLAFKYGNAIVDQKLDPSYEQRREGVKPVAQWQFRRCSKSTAIQEWSTWENCSEGMAEVYRKGEEDHRHDYEVRALYLKVEQPSARVALSDEQIAEVIHLARQQWQNAWTYTPAKIAEIVADSAAQTGESK